MSTAHFRDRTSRDRGSDSRPARGGGYEPRRKRPSNGRRPASQGQRNGRQQAPTARSLSPLETALQASAAMDVQARSFAELGLPESAVTALNAGGITDPTDVQIRTIPDALAGRDLLGRAQTGSGKTLAFGLPVVLRLAGGRSKAHHPRALVLTPTRELAQQVAEALSPIARTEHLRVLPIFGGAPMGRQTNGLAGGADVVVATPGRLEDHLRRGNLELSQVEMFVLDEADHMADLGFLPAVTAIMDRLPADAQRLMFSATLDRGVEQLAATKLQDPAVHAASAATADIGTMEHHAFQVTADGKFEVAERIAARHGRTLVFVRTKHGADRLARRLRESGLATESIHGNRSQAQRQRALADFESGRRPVLVATDVAARGIHVDDVDLVMHFDPPADPKDYLHRSGRTARAGRSGIVVSLVLPGERRGHQRLVATLDRKPALVVVDPDSRDVVELGSSGTPVTIKPMAAAPEASSGRGGNRRTRRPRNNRYRAA